MTIRTAKPIADTSVTAWSPSSGATLFDKIDEANADDTGYINATALTNGYKCKLSALPDANDGTLAITLRVKSAAAYEGVTAQVLEGSTVIAERRLTIDIVGSYATLQISLTVAEVSAITDFSNLYLSVSGNEMVSILFAASEVGVLYDPADFATLFQDSAGTIPVTDVGQPVGKILDKSGNGYHATQATSTARPILRQSGSLYYLEFDGIDDFLVTPSIDFSGTDKMSVFAGFNQIVTPTATALLLEHGRPGIDAGKCQTFICPARSGTVLRIATQLRDGTLVSEQRTGNDYTTGIRTFSGMFDMAQLTQGTQATLRINGVLDDDNLTHGSGVAAAPFDSQALYIGSRSGTGAFNGHLYSLVVRGALSDAAQIAAAESYVNSKTGAY